VEPFDNIVEEQEALEDPFEAPYTEQGILGESCGVWVEEGE